MDMDIDEFSYKDDDRLMGKSKSTNDFRFPSPMTKPKDFMKGGRLSPTSQSSITSLTDAQKFGFDDDDDDKQESLIPQSYDNYRTESMASFISVSDLNVRSFLVNRPNLKKRKICRVFERNVQSFKDNKIVTSKYNLFTFLPLNLMV